MQVATDGKPQTPPPGQAVIRHAPDPLGPRLEPVDYAEGKTALRGWFAAPPGGGPGVIVAHEAPGLDDHARARAQMLACAGYAALAIDMYGEPFDLAAAPARHSALMAEPGLLLRRAAAGVEALVQRARVWPGPVGAVGFCQGGVVAAELAFAGLADCAVGLHPALARPARPRERITGSRIVMVVGDDDPYNPPAARAAYEDQLRRSGADWTVMVHGGVRHTFTNPAADAVDDPGLAYDARADRRSWRLVLDVFGERLWPLEPAPRDAGL